MNTINVSIDKLYEIAYDTLVSMGIPEELAARGAKTLNSADVRGVDSHGVSRLKFYERCIKAGEIKPRPDIRILNETPVSTLFDCDYGIGIATADLLIDKAIELAKKNGIGIASGIKGHHFGIAAHYTLKAANEDLISFVCAPSFPLIAPIGGKEKILGNSPHSIAFPAGHKTPPIMFDMASSLVAGGKVEMALRQGQKVPFGWILDNEGNDTQDPADFINLDTGEIVGSLLPMAGPKGYCITVMIELLSSVLAGAKIGKDLTGGGKGLGFLMVVIDPNIIRPIDELKRDLDEYFYTIKKSPRKDGVNEIFLPGEIEYKNAIDRKQNGIDLNKVVAKELLDLAIQYNRLPDDAEIEDLLK